MRIVVCHKYLTEIRYNSWRRLLFLFFCLHDETHLISIFMKFHEFQTYVHFLFFNFMLVVVAVFVHFVLSSLYLKTHLCFYFTLTTIKHSALFMSLRSSNRLNKKITRRDLNQDFRVVNHLNGLISYNFILFIS